MDIANVTPLFRAKEQTIDFAKKHLEIVAAAILTLIVCVVYFFTRTVKEVEKPRKVIRVIERTIERPIIIDRERKKAKMARKDPKDEKPVEEKPVEEKPKE